MTDINRKYCEYLIQDNNIVEIRRQLDARQWTSYFFDNVDDLYQQANELSIRGNLFTTLNHMTNKPNGATKNNDIDRYTRIVFDFDPVRPTGVSSTGIELDEARATAIEFTKHMIALGWPEPLKALSGNGAHTQYRTFMANNSETKEMLKILYQGLQKDFTTDTVEFDPTVRNAARIFALYGSFKRKGISTKQRPHRQSKCVIPQDWKQVSPKQIEEVANYYSRQVVSQYKPKSISTPMMSNCDGRGDYSTLDIAAMFQSQGLYLTQVEAGKHYVKCPWSAEHSSTGPKDTVTWEAQSNQWPTFHCSHSHCDGRNIQDVINLFGGADTFCSQEYKGVKHEA